MANAPQPRINYPHFAWSAWRIVFQVGIKQNSFKAKQLIRDPPYDSYETCQESKGRGLLWLVKRKTFIRVLYLPGSCCIAIGTLEPVNGDIKVPFLGPESQLKSGFACAGLLCQILCFLLNKTQLKFLFVARVGLAVDFAILGSHFWYRQTVPKMEP